MKISNNWLQEYIKTDLKPKKIAEYLTDTGLEVEGIESFESIKGSLQGIVVGKVMSCEKHPNADRLSKTTVDVGTGTLLDIVCGAPNVAAGQTVAVATVGTIVHMPDGGSFEIKEAKIRGEKSQGMICAEDELGLGKSHEGIMVLDDEKYVVGEPLANYFDVVQDEVYEIGLTPNRTDAMSHYGVARDLNAFLVTNNIKPEFEKVSARTLNPEGTTDFQLEVEDSELCPRYIGAVLHNVTVAESPAWLKNRLLAIGVQPINNVVDVTNYMLHSYGQPLHAFDAGKIGGNKIIVGTVEAGTPFTTLEGTERKLNGSEIIIKDGNHQPLCIAGVFGGMDSGVSDVTTKVFLESAYFNPVAVRKAAKYHGLNTDASFRFERGADPHITHIVLTHAVELLEEIAGARLVAPPLEHYPTPAEDHYIILRFSKIEQILGIKIHMEKIKEILKALEIKILNDIPNGLEISVPAYRADVTREIDVIEEILRIYGYNKVDSPKKISYSPVKLNFDGREALENSWSSMLKGNGFNEVMNNSLTAVKDETDAVKLLNPLSKELAFMRTSLLEGLLDNAEHNIHRKSPDLKFFELGNIYHKNPNRDAGGSYARERKQLAMLVTGREKSENWLLPKSATNFYFLKGYVMQLLSLLNLNTEEKPLEDDRFSDGLEIVSGRNTIARLGKVAPQLLKEFDVDQECFYAEIEVDHVQEIRPKGSFKFRDIPKFNVLRRDLALLIDQHISYSDLYASALENKSEFLKKINLFDVYEGDKLPAGKKSYAMSFELLNEEKTLEEKEITEVMNGLVTKFRSEFGAELRG